ncbi:MAG: tRNA (adenosine(37)-N6)-threonylcarbamoyltransferase complex ATPase subunit type 1 TsaE [Anaerolineaceae bacterium]|nr:tRNA (adenosine(37)-N6)-threonylcarbamoyltransferase complex ATPase subunit type 1 TsaE [Anaerolineaceae bacterium]
MPILAANHLEFLSRSPEQTRRIGMRLGKLLNPGDLVCLSGDLGAGKTTLVQGLAQGWGSLDQATSPTFVLVNVYHRPNQESLYHLDAYRLENAMEAEDLDLDNMLENSPLIIEWAERIQKALPLECLTIQLRWVAEERRNMILSPAGERYENMVAELRRSAFGGG